MLHIQRTMLVVGGALLLSGGPAAARCGAHTAAWDAPDRPASEAPLVLDRSGPLELDIARALAPRAGPAVPGDELPPEDALVLSHWKSQVELGLNGSAGNSENLNLRGGATFRRQTERNDSQAGLLFTYATSDGTKTNSRFEGNLRHDYVLAPDSPWSIFGQGKVEYDEFQSWNYRTQLFGGAGYAFIREEDLLLRGRVGAGFTKEFGGQARNELIPEGLVGLDVEWQITQRTKFVSLLEYYPSFEDTTEYRLLGRAGLEIMVDPELNMSLKLGVEDRYNSQPGAGRHRNDVEYFITLAFGF